METQTLYELELTHDEIIALSRAILYYAQNPSDQAMSDAQLKDEITTLFHLHTLANKLPTLESE